eukprot:CAMPEP_0170564528 /NCGR_PEP_ID=MMETSP0211-20121228/73395_1 /TAXON_ID=311385 /ORGANISM="Pseudokeronopsis sp., Strain OXSARD2" /LENGTH=121 /DNA_ID=CAMNT_0010884107 /DNA_START=591 /DNA_END=953 /DNA_ORIENTATION=+
MEGFFERQEAHKEKKEKDLKVISQVHTKEERFKPVIHSERKLANKYYERHQGSESQRLQGGKPKKGKKTMMSNASLFEQRGMRKGIDYEASIKSGKIQIEGEDLMRINENEITFQNDGSMW